MIKKLNNVSKEAVTKATGKNWDQWIAFIDNGGGEELDHKEIVAILKTSGGVESPWWQQMVTVGYEFAKGRRITGETTDAGFQIGVQKTIPLPRQKLWDLLFDDACLKLWLGDVESLRPEPGFRFEGARRLFGEVRTVHPGERIRMKVELPKLAHASTLQITLSCPRNNDQRTTLRFHHEKLLTEDERAAMKDHWQWVAAKVASLAQKSA